MSKTSRQAQEMRFGKSQTVLPGLANKESDKTV